MQSYIVAMPVLSTTLSTSPQFPGLEGKGNSSLGAFDKPKSRHQHIQPQPPSSSDNGYFTRTADSEDLSSLFDFDSTLKSDLPKKPAFSKELSFGLNDGWDPLAMLPLSPPDSAAYSDGNWKPFDHYQQTPQNILTQIDPSRARAQYGQTTPPDDEQFNSLETELLLQDQQGHDIMEISPSADELHHKRPSDTVEMTVPPKRVRKSGGRASKKDSLDPSNPEDFRRSKFLERNRVAASKCRQKKKEWTNNLENRARQLQKDNRSLRNIVDSCKEEILFLKGEMLKHNTCSCTEIQEYLKQGAKPFTVKQEPSPVSSAQTTRVGSPSDHAHPQILGYGRQRSRAFSEELSRAQSPSDQALELLLTSQFTQDTSEEGIAQQLCR